MTSISPTLMNSVGPPEAVQTGVAIEVRPVGGDRAATRDAGRDRAPAAGELPRRPRGDGAGSATHRRPQLVGDAAVAGICLIRLGHLRPSHVPRALGLRSENAAHRVAVEWDTPSGPRTGVYIPRRDSDSWATIVFGGRIYPGRHHRARFCVHETDDQVDVAYASLDGSAAVEGVGAGHRAAERQSPVRRDPRGVGLLRGGVHGVLGHEPAPALRRAGPEDRRLGGRTHVGDPRVLVVLR